MQSLKCCLQLTPAGTHANHAHSDVLESDRVGGSNNDLGPPRPGVEPKQIDTCGRACAR